MRRLPLLVALAIGWLGAASQAMDRATAEWLWIDPVDAPEGDPMRSGAWLEIPDGWRSGDAAVVLAFDGSAWPLPERDALLQSLLAAGAATLLLDGETLADAASPDGETPELSLARAWSGLWQVSRSGVVLVIGHGRWAEVALDLAQSPAAPPFAAHVAVGPDALRFRPGAPPPPDERWDQRVGGLCDVLATPRPGSRHATGEAASAACRATLDPAARLAWRLIGEGGIAQASEPSRGPRLQDDPG